MMKLSGVTWLIPLLAGCGGVVVGVPGETTEALVSPSGKMQNGKMQNGKMQNGKMQNGVALALAGVDLTTMKRLIVAPAAGQPPDVADSNLVAVPNVTLTKTTLSDGQRSGTAFQGYVVDGQVTDGSKLYDARVYLESIVASADPEILHYTLKAHHAFVPVPGDPECVPSATDDCTIWEYVCGTVARQVILVSGKDGQKASPDFGTLVPTVAIAIGGQWDYSHGEPDDGRKTIEQGNPAYNTQITFACVNGAIGKCVEQAGYKPWATTPMECTGSQLIGNYRCLQTTQELIHESCVRMVRADYCGDGVDHTMDGMDLDVYDAPGVIHETPYGPDGASTVPYGHEAEWTPKGARCLSQLLMTRIAGSHLTGTVKDYLGKYCGDRWPANENGHTPFDWGYADCFGTDSSFNLSGVSFKRIGPNNYSLNMDLHDRAWLRNKSVCVDDSYDGKATPSTSMYPNNHNWDRYDSQWCGVCLKDPALSTVCGLESDI